MAAAAVAKSSKPSSDNKENVSPNASNASKPDPAARRPSTDSSTDNIDNPYFRELQRNLRNAVKKLNSTAKVDAILAENPGKSLDELVADKKINTDQKTQALKKPTLQANVAQIEEQIAHFKEFAAHYEDRLASQKSAMEKAHQEELDAFREKTVAEATKTSQKEFSDRLLALSRFLCTAAVMRQSGDEASGESRAFEGVLFQVYGGSQEAVASMSKLIDGSDEKVPSVEGGPLEFTYGKVKQAAEEYTKTDEAPAQAAPASDPTLANAAYTELQDTQLGADSAAANEPTPVVSQPEQKPPPAQTMVFNAANPVAESTWDSNVPGSLSSSGHDSWVEVPRNPAETDTGLQATTTTVDTGLKDNPTAVQTSGAPAESAPVPMYEAAAEVVGVDAVNSEAADVATLEDAGEDAGAAEADPTADRQQQEPSN
ncbi:hypothetical protein PHISP_01277 [Aspergillus sp. HF37]|nr:hypothetical protein PHISP_01277 [Aspergillus sp. HF37]